VNGKVSRLEVLGGDTQSAGWQVLSSSHLASASAWIEDASEWLRTMPKGEGAFPLPRSDCISTAGHVALSLSEGRM
jgi:hypothetical protein